MPSEENARPPAIQQKRLVAFINDFVITTAGFLNDFQIDCENKFINIDNRLRTIHNELLIVEAKLASVPGNSETIVEKKVDLPDLPEIKPKIEQPVIDKVENIEEPTVQAPIPIPEETSANEQSTNSNLVKICADGSPYSKFFKMLKFGVPVQGVKNKMISEEVDPDLLDDPEKMVEKEEIIEE